MQTPVRPAGASVQPALAGTALWIVTVAAAVLGAGDLTLTDALLLLAVLVIVPAAIPLHPAAGDRSAAVATVVAVPVAPALLVDQGVVAALLVVPWAIAAVVAAVVSSWQWWTGGRRPRELVWPVAAVYLVVGAAWLLADRCDVEPAGFAAPFVQLTAVHFHYAGFAAAVLVGCAWRWCPASRAAAAAAVMTMASPPIVAVGFTYLGLLQVIGAAVLTVGLWLLAWVTVRYVAPQVSRRAGVLLVVSSVAVLIPMALAVQWALGTNVGTPALSIPDMVRTHGVANAFGFTLLGVTGWRLVQSEGAGPL